MRCLTVAAQYDLIRRDDVGVGPAHTVGTVVASHPAELEERDEPEQHDDYQRHWYSGNDDDDTSFAYFTFFRGNDVRYCVA